VDSDADGVHNACDINPDYFDPEQADRDTLAALHCDSGEVAKWDGQKQLWSCAPDDDNDTWLSEDQVLEMVSTVGYLLSETDPLFTQSPAAGISEEDREQWASAYGWGDHSQASAASVISDGDMDAWSMAYAWGDHEEQGYLKSESDPEVGQVTEGKWCRGQAGQVACDQEPPEDKDTLGGLNCATDEIAKWNGSAWVCAEPAGSGGRGAPSR